MPKEKTSKSGSNLVIVESPAKAKTIENFLGKDFSVKSSFGHIRDLPKKGISVDIENGFAPTYELSSDKTKVLNELKKSAASSSQVWLATDEDREGEAIAWHLAEALGLDPKKTRRIVFHEITKPAILAAIENPRQLDLDLINAQQARRVLDRLVGYELSPILWKKIRSGLSAGRVQSVAVRIVVEREREIDAFEAQSSFKISAEFDVGSGAVLSAQLAKNREGLEAVQEFLEQVKPAEYTVTNIEKKPAKRSSKPPFTTSTLQQAASQKLGFSVKQTMVLAQRLYESGRITYMRTDSVNLSQLALDQAENLITSEYGEKYSHRCQYKTKAADAQEAHEAIRPTDLSKMDIKGERNEQRLYQLIWQRTMASQMADAEIERTTATVDVSTVDENLLAKGEVLTFDGFLKVYQENGAEDKMLPPLEVGQKLTLQEMKGQESFTRAPARYTEANLVKKLEELGIGRPSTYAPTISTIQDRGYIEKTDREGVERLIRILVLRDGHIVSEDKTEITGAEKNKLFPLDIAGVVTDFLVKHFTEVIDYNFTARVEEEFDEIATGKMAWQDMIAEFYKPFHTDVEKAEDVSREEASQTRVLGNDPKSGKPISVKIGRFGPYAQIGTRDDEDKPQFAGLRPGQRMDSVTLEEVLPLFELPRCLGETESGEIVNVNVGRFGPYASYVDERVVERLEALGEKGIELVAQNVSIEPEDPHVVEMEAVLGFIEQKKKDDADKEIQLFEGSPIQVLDGRWGPFITDGLKNAKMPKDQDPKKLTLAQCEQFLAETQKVKKRISRQFYGGGFELIRDTKKFPDAIIKAKANKLDKALAFADALAAEGKLIRVISAEGAAARKKKATNGATGNGANGKTTPPKKPRKKSAAAKKAKTTRKTSVKKATKKKAS